MGRHEGRGEEPAAPQTARFGMQRIPERGGAAIVSFREMTPRRSPHFPRLERERSDQFCSLVVQQFVCSQEHPVGSALLRGEEAEGGGRGMNKK